VREETGSALIEVMVGAVVLSIATVGILNGLDGAQSAGAKNKARSVVAALAEQDIERMRSMAVTSLPGYNNSRIVTVRGVDYTVVSKGSWAVDTGGPISCSNISRTAANVRIVSEVTSNATNGKVDQVSLVTPPPGTYAVGEGRAIVKVQDRDAGPVQGMGVTLAGPGNFTATTNSLGCAVFPFIPIGNYTATVSGGSYVDWDGDASPTKSLTVNQSQSTAVNFEMDEAAEIRAQFETVIPTSTPTTATAQSRWLTVSNSKMIVGSKLFTAGGSSPATATSINATGLFPFLDGYQVYPGQCTANAAGAKSYSTGPNEIVLTGSNRLRLPSINVRVVTSSSTTSPGPTGVNGATMVITSANSGCGNVFPTQTSSAMTYGTTTLQGALQQPGFPYGSYRICAQRTVSGVTTHGHADRPGYNNTSSSDTNEVVPNNTAGGNNLTFGSGLIRIWIHTNGPCH
jgi:Tfp pilus assembly protein PilV